MCEQPLIETLVFGDVDPVHRIENVEVERQQAVEKLHRGADDGQRGEREVEQPRGQQPARFRSEEHTSELQSLMRISYAVFCLKQTNTLIYDNTRVLSNTNHN